ncbi:MAG: O-antigen ligase family protein [Candidatus Omnitrophica bacterium]|nr:O-antigen ligase family protein [Candidatus Omnitrophota bacterium]
MDRHRFNFTEKFLFLYIGLIPFMQVPTLPLFGQKIQYSDLIFPIIFVIWVVRILQRKNPINIDKFDFFILALLVLFSISVVISPNRLKSGIEYMGLLYLFCVYFLIKQLVANANSWWRIINLWAIISFAVLLIGIGSYITTTLIGYSNPFVKEYTFVSFLGSRICSTFRNPNMLAAYLHVTIVFGFILLRRAQELKQKTFWVYLLIAMCLLGSFLTKTRILAGILLSLFLILMLPQKSKLLLRSRYLVLIGFIFVSLLAFTSIVWRIFPIDIRTNGETPNIKFNLTHFPYYSYNKAALAMIKDKPFFGVGMGIYNTRFMEYADVKEMESSFHVAYPDYEKGKDPATISVKQNGVDPHSTYLGWAAETGLFSLAAIIMMFFYYCSRIISHFRREINDFNRYIVWCFFAGMCGFLLNGLYIDIFTMRHFWIFIGMGAALLLIINSLKERKNEFVYNHPRI